MKKTTKTILLLFIISSFYALNAQNGHKMIKTTVTATTKTDPKGTHTTTTIQKDSIVGDITYSTETVKTKTVVYKQNSKITTESSYTNRFKTKPKRK